MCVSQTNNRLFLAIVCGAFMLSGCSGHSVKYGSNSEGDGMVSSEQDMNETTNGMDHPAEGSYAGGTTVPGGTVNGSRPYARMGQGTSPYSSEGGDRSSNMTVDGGTSAKPDASSDYGQQYGGVDGSGPNHGPVTGFGSGSAASTNPDPEAWANAYLRGGNSTQEFYGDPSSNGSSSGGSTNAIGDRSNYDGQDRSNYGHDYAGVQGSGPNYGSVDGFSDSSASPMTLNPESWAQAYLRENGGPAPEYVTPERNVMQGHDNGGSGRSGMRESSGLAPFGTSNSHNEADGRVQDIYFAFDSWSISQEAARYLEEGAQWLHANPTRALTIEGHCDQRGTQDYNLVLGKKRAEAARDYLIKLGVQRHRINIVSYGKERPACQDANENCFQENRRSHMVVRTSQS